MNKVNKEFLTLQAIGIFIVVVGHKDGSMVFSDWFPAYSFHMPLFIFISGYFYKQIYDNKPFEYIKKKFTSLVITYFIWNLVYGLLGVFLSSNNLINHQVELTFETFFIEPWITGHQYHINVASWFLLSLFLVQVTHVLMKYLVVKCSKVKEYFLLIVYFSVGLLSLLLASRGYHYDGYLTIVRTLFLLPFFQLGYVYHLNESKIKISNTIYFAVLFSIQFILIYKYHNLNFSAVFLGDIREDYYFLPYLTSITGILFWLRIAKIVTPIVADNKLVQLIGQNTLSIMLHHQFIFWLINFGLYSVKGSIELTSFDVEAFKSNMWYSYTPTTNHFYIIYVLLGIGIPIAFKYVIEKSKLVTKDNHKFQN